MTPHSPVIDPLADIAIRDGHRRILDGFREFLPDLRASRPDPVVARAAVGFLRDRLNAFARWEEDQLRSDHTLREDVAFEHAFLEAETDGLARALEQAFAGDARAARDLARRADRIEAILELHAAKHDDRPVLHAAPDDEPIRGPETIGLEPEEVDRVLRAGYWGVLSTIGEAGPYGVPVSYGWSGQRAFIASGPGRKLRNLEREPVACLTVVALTTPHDWTSVVIEGRVQRVTRPAAWATAIGAIRRQRMAAGGVRAEELRRVLGATIFELDPGEMGGRQCGRPQMADALIHP